MESRQYSSILAARFIKHYFTRGVKTIPDGIDAISHHDTGGIAGISNEVPAPPVLKNHTIKYWSFGTTVPGIIVPKP